ncbi:hypothetical protein H5410_013475 [Solanum commersonii]|uniref:F-box domain-containing protein n=1 Tax=Solanum commersonii TaxID=4109 RepID=A0A9J6AV74_SOLCO|nr:hypothetical protein H5410_013475 [Solanum commersonii]
MTSMNVLSVCVIHKILSYLSFQEAAKLSLVSKTWLQAWLAHPNLEFAFPYGLGDDKIVDQLADMWISEGFLQHLISTSQFLENLALVNSIPKLLIIDNSNGLWEIDAPNLVSLEYDGDLIPQLKIAKESHQLKNSRISLLRLKNLNVAWFDQHERFGTAPYSCNPQSERFNFIYRVVQRKVPNTCGCFAMELSS